MGRNDWYWPALVDPTWLSFGVVEGVSINSELSNYEAASWQYSSVFLNYLAAEIAVQINPQWSVVGRIHHRSGATAPMTELKKAVTATCSVFVTTLGNHPSRESKKDATAIGL